MAAHQLPDSKQMTTVCADTRPDGMVRGTVELLACVGMPRTCEGSQEGAALAAVVHHVEGAGRGVPLDLARPLRQDRVRAHDERCAGRPGNLLQRHPNVSTHRCLRGWSPGDVSRAAATRMVPASTTRTHVSQINTKIRVNRVGVRCELMVQQEDHSDHAHTGDDSLTGTLLLHLP